MVVVSRRRAERFRGWGRKAAAIALGALVGACATRDPAPSLERTDDENVAVPDIPPPPADGPRLGAVAHTVPVYDRPSRRGRELGELHAGATVARAATPVARKGCDGGWYAIHPRGFVCAGAGAGATVDLAHPTLAAMALQPDRGAVLPYTYARAVRDTTLFSADPSQDDRVRAVGPLRAKSGFAVVGSWTAAAPSRGKLRLAMTTDGRFVPAEDLEALKPSSFAGVALDEKVRLPMAFVVKRGVHAFSFRDGEPHKEEALDYHARVELTGKRRAAGGVEYWAAAGDRFVRLTDVTLVRERHEFPQFATGTRKWIDVSIVTGTLVAYEGKTPKFATLVSVGRDRLGNATAQEGTEAVTRRGEFTVTAKRLTVLPAPAASDEIAVTHDDAPWALELSSGQRLVGAYFHDRFGIEHGPGDIQVSAADASTLFRWVEPQLPEGWHAVKVAEGAEAGTIVNVRK